MNNSRIWQKIDKGSADECWPYVGYVTSAGYGSWHPARGVKFPAHRLVWVLTNGPIQDDLVVDHMCHNETDCGGGASCPHRRCCNPAHLRLTTIGENVLAGRTLSALLSARSHCNKGHELTQDNLRSPRGRGRECRICWNRYNAGRVARKRAAA